MAAKCYLHILENENDDILPMSEKAKEKICLCKDKWITLDGSERLVSETLSNLFAIDCNSNLGFHKKCYARFTDKTPILKAEKRKQKQKKH